MNLLLKFLFCLSGAKKKPSEEIFRGLSLAICAPLEDSKTVSQHTSPERLVRMMVMMVAELNARHGNLVIMMSGITQLLINLNY